MFGSAPCHGSEPPPLLQWGGLRSDGENCMSPYALPLVVPSCVSSDAEDEFKDWDLHVEQQIQDDLSRNNDAVSMSSIASTKYLDAFQARPLLTTLQGSSCSSMGTPRTSKAGSPAISASASWQSLVSASSQCQPGSPKKESVLDTTVSPRSGRSTQVYKYALTELLSFRNAGDQSPSDITTSKLEALGIYVTTKQKQASKVAPTGAGKKADSQLPPRWGIGASLYKAHRGPPPTTKPSRADLRYSRNLDGLSEKDRKRLSCTVHIAGLEGWEDGQVLRAAQGEANRKVAQYAICGGPSSDYRSKFAFIEFDEEADAQECVDELNSRKFNVECSFAVTCIARGKTPGGSHRSHRSRRAGRATKSLTQ